VEEEKVESTSKNAGFIDNTLSKSIIQILRDAVGLNEAPRVFTQIMKKAMQVIREIWKVRCVIYFDNLFKLHQDQNYPKRVTLLLQHLG
jgi:hypothetical protein